MRALPAQATARGARRLLVAQDTQIPHTQQDRQDAEHDQDSRCVGGKLAFDRGGCRWPGDGPSWQGQPAANPSA